MTAPPLLEARGLRFGYEPGQEVLRGVDLTLRAGEILFVLGPNGCGKTTLVHLLCGCLEPAAGAVLLGGEDARAPGGCRTRGRWRPCPSRSSAACCRRGSARHQQSAGCDHC